MGFTKELSKLEEVLNDYNETLYADKQSKTFKSFAGGMLAIQNAWEKAFDKDRLKIIAVLDKKSE